MKKTLDADIKLIAGFFTKLFNMEKISQLAEFLGGVKKLNNHCMLNGTRVGHYNDSSKPAHRNMDGMTVTGESNGKTSKKRLEELVFNKWAPWTAERERAYADYVARDFYALGKKPGPDGNLWREHPSYLLTNFLRFRDGESFTRKSSGTNHSGFLNYLYRKANSQKSKGYLPYFLDLFENKPRIRRYLERYSVHWYESPERVKEKAYAIARNFIKAGERKESDGRPLREHSSYTLVNFLLSWDGEDFCREGGVHRAFLNYLYKKANSQKYKDYIPYFLGLFENKPRIRRYLERYSVPWYESPERVKEKAYAIARNFIKAGERKESDGRPLREHSSYTLANFLQNWDGEDFCREGRVHRAFLDYLYRKANSKKYKDYLPYFLGLFENKPRIRRYLERYSVPWYKSPERVKEKAYAITKEFIDFGKKTRSDGKLWREHSSYTLTNFLTVWDGKGFSGKGIVHCAFVYYLRRKTNSQKSEDYLPYFFSLLEDKPRLRRQVEEIHTGVYYVREAYKQGLEVAVQGYIESS